MIEIRNFEERDREPIERLCAQANMIAPESYEPVPVACLDGQVVGYLNPLFIDNMHYVESVVVDNGIRRQGIGRLLMDGFMGDKSEVRLIARSDAVEFYKQLGFTFVDWDEISPVLSTDCSSCSLHESCKPIPMAWSQKVTKGS